MSKKTRKKSSKVAPGAKRGKARIVKRASTKALASSAFGKSGKKAKAKQGSTTAAAPAKVPASTSKRAGAKAASARKAAVSTTKPKPVIPVRMAGTLIENKPAPAFSLPRDGGQLVSLATYAGRKLVIFFYPRADTPGCTREAMAFSRLANAFADAQTAVLGVSADPVATQEAFRDKHELTIPLLSDKALGMLKAYGVWGEKSMYGKTFMGIIRTTVLLDARGKVAKVWRNVRVDGHADEVLTATRNI
jgi:peroxiredoxin Q/BCP